MYQLFHQLPKYTSMYLIFTCIVLKIAFHPVSEKCRNKNNLWVEFLGALLNLSKRTLFIHSLYPDCHVQIFWWRLSEPVFHYHLLVSTFILVGTCNQGWLTSFLGKFYTSNTILYGTDMVFLIFICFRNCCVGWLWYRWWWSEFRTCFLSRWSCFSFAYHI